MAIRWIALCATYLLIIPCTVWAGQQNDRTNHTANSTVIFNATIYNSVIYNAIIKDTAKSGFNNVSSTKTASTSNDAKADTPKSEEPNNLFSLIKVSFSFISVKLIDLEPFFTFFSTLFMGYLTYLALGISAKPKIRISFDEKCSYTAGKLETLTFHLSNVGHWYGKPAATGLRLYVNFDPKFNLKEIKYGSILENSSAVVHTGKDNKKYLKAEGIILTNKEAGEDITIQAKMPDIGDYEIHIAAFSNEGDCGVHKFKIKIIQDI